jgi:imidazolonepropionase-like amidohydrolase
MTITGGVNSRIGAGLGAQMFEDEARAIVETAQLYERKVAVHAHGADGINLALAAGRRFDRARHAARRREAELFRESGAYYVPTLSTVNGYLERLEAEPGCLHRRGAGQDRWRIGITGKSLERACRPA